MEGSREDILATIYSFIFYISFLVAKQNISTESFALDLESMCGDRDITPLSFPSQLDRIDLQSRQGLHTDTWLPGRLFIPIHFETYRRTHSLSWIEIWIYFSGAINAFLRNGDDRRNKGVVVKLWFPKLKRGTLAFSFITFNSSNSSYVGKAKRERIRISRE